MTVLRKARLAAAALLAASAIATTVPAFAQEISESHLKAARETIDVLNATDEFDQILPAAAAQLKGEMIQRDPHLEELINQVVDQEALKLAARRGDLERESAMAYARTFSEQELNEITAFYSSPTGQKFQQNGIKVTSELLRAAEIWQRGLARDLTAAASAALAESQGGGQQAEQPAEEAPAQPAQ